MNDRTDLIKLSHIKIELIICAFVSAILLFLIFNPILNAIGDNAHYINLARAIYDGKGLVQLHTPGNPVETRVAPGFSAILAGIMAISGNPEPILIFKIFVAICLWLFLLLTYYFLRKYAEFGIVLSGLIALFLCFNVHLVWFSYLVITESVYLLIFAILLILLFKYNSNPKIGLLAIISLLCAAVPYIRFPAFPFVGAIVIWLLISRKYREAIVISVSTLVLFGFWLIPILFGDKLIYLAQAQQGISVGILRRILTNSKVYLFEYIPVFFMPFFRNAIKTHIVLGVISGLTIVGIEIYAAIADWKNRVTRLMALVALFFLMIDLIWFFSSMRFIAILAVPLIYLFIKGLELIMKRLKIERLRKIILAIVILAMCATAIPGYLDYIKNSRQARKVLKKTQPKISAIIPPSSYPPLVMYYNALKWCSENTFRDAVLISWETRLTYLIADRPALFPRNQTEPDSIWNWILDTPASYVVLDQFWPNSGDYLYPAMKGYPKCFTVVYQTPFPPTYVVRIDTSLLRKAMLVKKQR